MRNLLLVSSSRVHGSGFLEHCRDAITAHFQDCPGIVFVPYALQDHDGYTELVRDALQPTQTDVVGLHTQRDPVAAIEQAAGLFIGGGNSFRLLKTLYDLDLLDTIRDSVVNRSMPYMGTSAGTNMACPTIRTTNDMPIVRPPSFNALGLIPFQINPHFIDADPNSTHKGETREQRLAEYLEENDVPVAGIREGTWIRVAGESIELEGNSGMKWFQRGESPQEFVAGDDVSFLLH